MMLLRKDKNALSKLREEMNCTSNRSLTAPMHPVGSFMIFFHYFGTATPMAGLIIIRSYASKELGAKLRELRGVESS